MLDLKLAAARDYAAYLAGRGSAEQVAASERRLAEVTREPLPSVDFWWWHLDAGGKSVRTFRPFRQINSYYCGPATVQSILWHLGEEMGDGGLNLDSAEAQPTLAREEWLRTESGQGTDWGEVMPDTLNRWRDTSWYVASATPNAGGTLDKQTAFEIIQFSTDHGFPVAANVLYGPSTITPAGFVPGVTYAHWEVIYGLAERGGSWFVQVGQVYGSTDGTYVPLQEIPWDDYWLALGSWYGLVW